MTSVSTVVDSFLKKVEEDDDFFEYYNCTDEEALAIAQERAAGYVDEAVTYFALQAKGCNNVNFFDKTSDTFNFDLTATEVEILARIMHWIYLERGISKLKPVINSFTSSEIKMLFSPANERKTFLEMVNSKKKEVDILISNYRAVDRLTGKLKTINYDDEV